MGLGRDFQQLQKLGGKNLGGQFREAEPSENSISESHTPALDRPSAPLNVQNPSKGQDLWKEKIFEKFVQMSGGIKKGEKENPSPLGVKILVDHP
jgi:hypothetical protein